MPTIFLRIAWMQDYKGNPETDIPRGAGSYVEQHHTGGEIFNFMPVGGYYYGYVRVQGGKNLQIEMLGADVRKDELSGVTAVFFAKNPETGGQYVVGWYKNATIYRKEQVDSEGWEFRVKTRTKDGYLVPVGDRIFQLPKHSAGQANVWYVSYYDSEFEAETLKYIDDPDHYIARKAKRMTLSTPWQKDAELRKLVEMAAMKRVASYFILRNYEVEYRQKENLGWDLEATLGSQTLLLEVKGLSGEFNAVELTPNEYRNSKINKKHYRLCIVTHALDDRQKLHIYYKKDSDWVNSEGEVLSVLEYTSARFCK